MKKDNGKIIILLGAPGAGKGTQAHMLEEQCKVAQISTGDILRTIAKMDTDLGREVARVQRAGDLVSDAVSALVNLGYRRAEAFGAVSKVVAAGGKPLLNDLIVNGLRELSQ